MSNTWYPGPDGEGHGDQYQSSPAQHYHANAPAVSDSQRLLGVYPFASATPTSHVARHLSNLTISTPIPSFSQSQYHGSGYGQHHNPPPYSEYPDGVSPLVAPTLPPPGPERQYWDTHQSETVRLLSHQQSQYDNYAPSPYPPAPVEPYYQPQPMQPTYLHPSSNWAPPNYQCGPFASSILQSFPYTSFFQPSFIPPGATISRTSSLSMALAPSSSTRRSHSHSQSQPQPQPQSQSQSQRHPQPQPQAPSHSLQQQQPPQPPPPQSRVQVQPSLPSPPLPQTESAPIHPTYTAEQSSSFFNEFLAQTTREAAVKNPPPPPSPSPTPTPPTPPPVPTPVQRPPPALPTLSTSTFPPVTPRRPPALPAPESSPDPLALVPSQSSTVTRAPPTNVISTLKRKGEELLSPSVKRPSVEPSAPRARETSGGSTSSATATTTPLTSKGKIAFPHRRMEAYVEVPRLATSKSWTPVRSSMSQLTSQFLAGSSGGSNGSGRNHVHSQGSVSKGSFSSEGSGRSVKKSSIPDVRATMTKSATSKRTGDRDERGPLEKLVALVEDIFEAEDSLGPELPSADSEFAGFFSRLTVDPSRPLLSSSIITKLTKVIGQVARPAKRLRLATRENLANTPKQAGLATVEPQMLSRLLKLLERSVRIGEDLDPFVGPVVSGRSEVPSTPRKKKKAPNSKTKKGRKTPSRRSKTPKAEEEQATGESDGEGEDAMDVDAKGDELSEEDFKKLDRVLEMARESVVAADCCVALLSADKLPKQLYSEELITSCFGTIKNHLTKVIYPFVEATGDIHGHSTALLVHLVKGTAADAKARRHQIGEIFQILSIVIPRVDNLVSRLDQAMSDSIIIQAVYIAIGPFFVVESGTEGKGKDKNSVVMATLGGNSALRGLRLSALSLIRSIFAAHEEQRSWIIEEILTSLIKLPDLKQKSGQFRLRDGRSIHTVSALLLQLVQTSAHDVRIKARQFTKRRRELVAQASFASNGNAEQKEDILTDQDREEIRLYTSALDSATKAAKAIVLFLTQRSGKGKSTKNSNEAEYRAIFDNLISDLLCVLHWPEWPAASLLLSIVCKLMVSSLDDVKTANAADTNALKSAALDHLGVIAARLRSSALRFNTLENTAPSKSNGLKSIEEIIAKVDRQGLDVLISSHLDVYSHLSKRSTDDQAYDSARELTAATWGHEIASSLNQCDSILQKMADQGPEVEDERASLEQLALRLKVALREVWSNGNNDVFDVGSEADVARVDSLSEEIGSLQSLKNAFDPILNVILLSLDASAVFMRTKALRALGQIVTSDPTTLRGANVRKAIESHLLDSSPAVRDAAVELIGKYIIQMPAVAGDYYQRIADRIADTGMGVRKRVIKLLKSVYLVTDDFSRKVDICSRLVLRMLDEDDTVKDLAVKTVEELWFSETLDQPVVANQSEDNFQFPAKQTTTTKVAVIMAVTGHFRDRHTLLEDLFHQVATGPEGKGAANVLERYTEICDALIDSLVDAQDSPGFNVVNCIKTIYLFTTAHPSIISSAKAATLLPYLKNATTVEEQLISDYLLKIFRTCIPHMPKTATKFAQELQQCLQPMVIKPSPSGGSAALQETVSCLCVVVNYMTHDYVRLIGLLRSCNGKLREALARPANQIPTPAQLRGLAVLIYIVSLLGEHCDFDRLRTENEGLAKDINKISQGSITEYIYGILLTLYERIADPPTRGRILQCLGFLFRAHPTLMTKETSATMMDAIFESPELEARGRLLKIMQDFLISESLKHASQEKAANKLKSNGHVNMEELVGNTGGFAESGVSSAIVQRYLPQILDAALTRNLAIQASAVDILGFTIKQGLAHPLQCLPVIVALETSANGKLSSRALALHSILHTKHASLLNTRYLECARMSYTYQSQITDGPVQGYRMQPITTALLHHWYALVREKRNMRQDFLKAILKAFELDPSSLAQEQDDVDFARYMAENVSAFEYKTQEEVLTVIRHLTKVLSVAGMQLMDTLSRLDVIPADAAGIPTGEDVVMSDSQDNRVCMDDPLPFIRASVTVGIIMMLKSYLKSLYGMSEDKCSKWVPGKKSAVGDRPAVRRLETPISWDRMPFATAPVLTHADAKAQQSTLLELWSEDGVTEPEDDML